MQSLASQAPTRKAQSKPCCNGMQYLDYGSCLTCDADPIDAIAGKPGSHKESPVETLLQWDAISGLWELTCLGCRPHRCNRWQARLPQGKPGRNLAAMGCNVSIVGAGLPAMRTLRSDCQTAWIQSLASQTPAEKARPEPYQVFGACSYKGSTLGIAACKAAIRLLEAG